MSEAVALYNVEGDVAIISMNRPEKRNALSTELKEKLIEFFQNLNYSQQNFHHLYGTAVPDFFGSPFANAVPK